MAANLLPPFADPIAVDIFDTTQSGSVTSAADQVLTLTKVVNNNSGTPTTIPTAGYIALDVNDSSKFEIAFYDSLNVGAKTVRLHVRGIAGGANAHSAAPCRMNMVASYLNDLAQAVNDREAKDIIKYVNGDVVKNNTTVLGAVSDLNLPVKSGERWILEYTLFAFSNAAAGIDFQFSGASPSGASHVTYELINTAFAGSGIIHSTGAVATENTLTFSSQNTHLLKITLYLSAAGDGTWTFSFAQSTAVVLATAIQNGSFLKARRLT